MNQFKQTAPVISSGPAGPEPVEAAISIISGILLKKGMIVPEHSHHNEQLTYVVEGALKFWIDGKEIVVRGGEVLCIPSNMPHKAEALEDTVDLDVFYPPRQDWLDKSDAYLRNAEPAHSR